MNMHSHGNRSRTTAGRIARVTDSGAARRGAPRQWAIGPPTWTDTGNRAEHVQHERHRPLYHDSSADVGAWRAPGDARMARSSSYRHTGRHDLERAWRGNARLGRVIPLPERRIRPRFTRPFDRLPVHLAIHSEWP